jgi:hypothetical protein
MRDLFDARREDGSGDQVVQQQHHKPASIHRRRASTSASANVAIVTGLSVFGQLEVILRQAARQGLSALRATAETTSRSTRRSAAAAPAPLALLRRP